MHHYYICKIIAPLLLKKPDCSQQNGSNDCGLFAIANATAFCFGVNPSYCVWHQTKMRCHSARYIRKSKLEMFPNDICQQISDVYATAFDVYCHCRLPFVEIDRMMECDRYKSWYHQECENISSSHWQKLKESSMAFCSSCKQSSRYGTSYVLFPMRTHSLYHQNTSSTCFRISLRTQLCQFYMI